MGLAARHILASVRKSSPGASDNAVTVDVPTSAKLFARSVSDNAVEADVSALSFIRASSDNAVEADSSHVHTQPAHASDSVVETDVATTHRVFARTASDNAVASDSAARQNYDAAVAADSPTHWWKMGDSSGTSLADSAGSTALAVSGGTVTLNQTGIPGSSATAALFAGAAEGLQGGSVFAAPKPVSIELWFKSTVSGASGTFSASTAPMITFGQSSSFDRQIGLVTGHVQGYSYPNAIDSSLTYNDGNWHHVVLTITSGNAGVLYVDGSSVATGTLTLNSFSGVWDVGAAYSGGVFAGTLAHVAVYHGVVLTSTQVSTHYNAGI